MLPDLKCILVFTRILAPREVEVEYRRCSAMEVLESFESKVFQYRQISDYLSLMAMFERTGAAEHLTQIARYIADDCVREEQLLAMIRVELASRKEPLDFGIADPDRLLVPQKFAPSD